MGGHVYDLGEPPHRTIRWYCHANPRGNNRLTYVIVNHSAKPFLLETPTTLVETYILCSAGPLTSHYLLLNGELLEEDLLTNWRKKRIKEKYHIRSKAKEPYLEIPSYGSAFLVLQT